MQHCNKEKEAKGNLKNIYIYVPGCQLTASGRVSSSGWSGGVHFRISFNNRGYLTRRLRGRSKKFHRSSFLLKDDS